MKRSDKLRAGKFDVDVALVERLIARQFPQWADLPVVPVAEDGWDNWTFRLGRDLKVRLPSAEGYAEQAAKEARWLPLLAPQLPLTIPVPLALGSPDADYPWLWSVYEWLDGEPVRRDNVTARGRLAQDLADFLLALGRIDATDGPRPGGHNFLRGAPILDAYGEQARECVEALGGVIDQKLAHAVLDAAGDAPWRGNDQWLHGDIAIGNLLVREGRLSAVIDFGTCGIGDPACDLVIAWTYFSGPDRLRFRDAIGGSPGLWARARGWALWKAALLLASGQPANPEENSPLSVIEAVIGEYRDLA